MDTKIYDFINNAYFKQKTYPIFEHFLKPNLEKLEAGKAIITMEVLKEHLNLHRITHGGVLATIADLTMGIACISYYKNVVTTDMSISFIKNVGFGKNIKAIGIVEHNGNKMMRTSCNIYDEDGNLLIKAMASFFVVGELDIDSYNDLKEE